MKDIEDKIINTSLELFKQYGIRSVSVDDICRAISISKKTFYVYFPKKEDLVAASLEKMNRCSEKYINDFMKGKTAIECIRQLMEMHSKVSDVHKVPAFNYDLQKYYPQLYKEHIKAVHAGTKLILMKHLQQGKEEGVYRADLDVETCAIMYSLIQQAVIRNEDDIKSVSPKRLVRFTMESFFRSIVSDEGIHQAQQLYEKDVNNK
mgnify:CR=1 FL=1